MTFQCLTFDFKPTNNHRMGLFRLSADFNQKAFRSINCRISVLRKPVFYTGQHGIAPSVPLAQNSEKNEKHIKQKAKKVAQKRYTSGLTGNNISEKRAETGSQNSFFPG